MKKIFCVLAALVAAAGIADARKVKGTVTSGEKFLEGVVVTDGSSFTATNFKGQYTLDVREDAEYVYVVTPAGYVADWSSGVPAFYQSVDGKKKIDFDLQKTCGGFDYNIMAVSDPQFYSLEQFEMFAGKPVADMTATAKSLTGVTVGLALGDIGWDESARLDDYKKAIVKTGVPFYPVVGNHDNNAWCHGDLEGSAIYRSKMGPENYAFFLGKDVVIVLDNIIYDTNFKSTAGYADHVIAWVKGFMPYVPADADIYIAQHAPTMRGKKKIQQANALLDLVRGHKVTFLSGHTHVNDNFTIEKNITEHNIAAICGAWWDTELCTDGTPRGYKVLTKFGGKLSWYYKPVGYSKKHIAELTCLGQAEMHPNSVVVNVWDWDPQWKVEWYEDGMYMGSMDQVAERSSSFTAQLEAAYAGSGEEIPGWKRGRPSRHNFAAMPSRYAQSVTVIVQSRFGQKWTQTADLTDFVEEQRVCDDVTYNNIRELAESGANSVVMDLCVGMDGQVKLSGTEGLLMTELIDSTDSYLSNAGRSALRYNLQMHTVVGKEEGRSVPYYHRYADYVMDSLWTRFLGERLLITGSDFRALNHLNSRYPEVDIAFKVEKGVEDIEKALAKLKFTPRWISIHHSIADQATIRAWQQKGFCVSVWGITDDQEKNRIKALKPDAVIY